jgi:hypothetical protein
MKRTPSRPAGYILGALLSAVAVVALVGCGATTATTSVSSPTASSRTPNPSSTTSLDANQFICGTSSAFAQPGLGGGFIDAVRTGTHTGYDRLTIGFQNGQPESIELSPQTGATFGTSPKGEKVKLAGQDGLVVNIFSTDAHTAYSGPTDIKTGYSGLLEVRELQDFEGYVTWGLGLSKPACYHAVILTNPTRLVIDIQVS